MRNPTVIISTQSIDSFWKEVQTIAANEYSLEETQIVSNSDGGSGYSVERFKEAFSQSNHSVLHQLDDYHIQQAVNRTFGYKQSDGKDKIREALEEHNLGPTEYLIKPYYQRVFTLFSRVKVQGVWVRWNLINDV